VILLVMAPWSKAGCFRGLSEAQLISVDSAPEEKAREYITGKEEQRLEKLQPYFPSHLTS